MFDYIENEKLKSRYHSFYLDGYLSDESADKGIREAKGRLNLYTRAPVYIEPEHLITGRLDKALQHEAVNNYVSNHEYHRDVIEGIIRSDDYSCEYKDYLKTGIEKFASYLPLKDIKALATADELLVEESGAAFCQHYNGHMVMDYEYAFKKGLAGIASDIRHYKDVNGADSFYDALLLTIEGMSAYIMRHSELARELLNRRECGYDAHRLRMIADCCESISSKPPRSFYEAVQLQWFIMQFADYDSFGRYDQYLFPFYEASVGNGDISRDIAKEYVKDVMRRIDENGSIINMTIGGTDRQGNTAVNELTYIVMEATREMRFKGPNLCLRLTASSEKRLWDNVAENLSTGQALPALYNDEVFPAMLKKYGVHPEDADDYCLAGCSQAIIPGKSNYSCDMGIYTPLKMLELALFDGYDHRLGKQVSIKTGDAGRFVSFEEVMAAYKKQMKYCVKAGVALNNHDNLARKGFLSCVRTIFTHPCIERGKGIFDGGAQYYGVHGEVAGITNTANALAAIKEFVFDRKLLTMGTLLTALRENFFGYENIRAMLKDCPAKFGNDRAFVDNLRGALARDIYNEISSFRDTNGWVHWPGEVIFNYYYDQGKYCIASADGRDAGSVLADSAGPSQGTDVSGPTAVINSALKLPHDLLYTSINLNLKFPRKLWDSARQKIISLFVVYFAHSGSQLQINVLDRDELLRAMECPEMYRGLIVRVGGYSAYFTQLPEEFQREIISRTENIVS